MPNCPQCGSDIRDGKTFCGKCGATVPAGVEAGAGTSRLELDPQLINTLLTMFVSKPGGPQVSFENGQVMVRTGDISVAVNPIQLKDAAMVKLQHQALGNLGLTVDLVQLGQQGLEVQLRLK